MVEKQDFDVYVTFGIVLKGKASEIQQILDEVKTYPNTKIIFTKTTAGKLELTEISNGGD